MATPGEPQMNDVLDMLERRIFMLRTEYEQYFLGLIKKEPADKREDIVTAFRNMERQRINNTAHNFRLQQLKARFLTLSQYWTRTLKQIEDGTFRRDQFRVKLRVKEEEEQQRQGAEKRKTAPQQPANHDTVEDRDALKGLFQEFLQTRQRCNERTDNVQFEKMVEFMQQQTKAIKERYQCKAVKFQVVEDGGKTKLKAVPVR